MVEESVQVSNLYQALHEHRLCFQAGRAYLEASHWSWPLISSHKTIAVPIATFRSLCYRQLTMTIVRSHHVDGLFRMALALLPISSIRFGRPAIYGIPSSINERPHADLRSRMRPESHRARVLGGQLPLPAESGLLLYK